MCILAQDGWQDELAHRTCHGGYGGNDVGQKIFFHYLRHGSAVPPFHVAASGSDFGGRSGASLFPPSSFWGGFRLRRPKLRFGFFASVPRRRFAASDSGGQSCALAFRLRPSQREANFRPPPRGAEKNKASLCFLEPEPKATWTLSRSDWGSAGGAAGGGGNNTGASRTITAVLFPTVASRTTAGKMPALPVRRDECDVASSKKSPSAFLP